MAAGGRILALTGTENHGANADAYHDLNVAEGKGSVQDKLIFSLVLL